jgi:hypothetical protein
VKTPQAPSAIVAGMTLSHAQTLFREAVHDLAEEPTPVNVQRYLAASQILDRAAQAEPAATNSGSNHLAKGEDQRAETLVLQRS